MIARLAPHEALPARYRAFLDALRARGFEGGIDDGHDARTVFSTDNSIYQRFPQAAVFPRHAADVQKVAALAAEPEYRQIVLAARGGGTGTNGQSLTEGVVVDLSRHMNAILEIDVEGRWARVQPGVVKDQLNAALRAHGLFFAPELSTSNRATIGGMINTDASGQGSCTYGKTRDHVLALDTVLLGGQRIHTTPLDEAALARTVSGQDEAARLHRQMLALHQEYDARVQAGFPRLNRCLTGYDLVHLRDGHGRFDLNSLLCGSEGSLGFIVEARLNVLPIPRHRRLVNVSYAGFMDALRDARALMALSPISIETVDSTVLGLAREDIVWHQVGRFFPDSGQAAVLGINLVEFNGDDLDALERQVAAFLAHLAQDTSVQRLGYTVAADAASVTQVYAMRKRAVGLLGNVHGEARPQPFVEDAAVPPEALPEFIAEFRALLDSHRLEYGMFGHVDAGVLHVRPALDMKQPAQAALVRPISDAVAALARKHGGLLWGEHGKGVRSEYAPAFFGELYPALQAVKQAFDPYNQLNPGKIATPADAPGAALLRIDEVAMRGQYDRQIDPRAWAEYGAAVHCNGNGACYNYDYDDPMCPSWKATRDRRHSPKGRAALVREWLRLQARAGVDLVQATARLRAGTSPLRWLARLRNSLGRRMGEPDFSHEVFEAMSGCLACKSCAGQCPVKVDIPDVRSRFLEMYHARYLRPLKDYLIGSLEFSVPTMARVPWLYNGALRLPPVRWLMRVGAGMVDSPPLSRIDPRPALRRWQVETATPELLAAMPADARARCVVLVQDAFTRYFETALLVDTVELFSRLGFRVLLAPFMPNGKPLQVLGFLGAFEKVARRNAAMLNALAAQGVPLVGLDPAMTLAYRHEYRKLLGADAPPVLLPQEWLVDVLPVAATTPAGSQADARFKLLVHCTEQTNAPAQAALWPQVFRRLGLELAMVPTGCCGMSGTYGHEAANVATSERIFDLSWGPAIATHGGQHRLLANGYSCRTQARRFAGASLAHPLQAIVQHLRALPAQSRE
ncbi:FAD-binding and (Fe-S)-binding domain-containing protein [Pseudoxanthomonas koreensis]|uniref:D-2-hydroxyglutarate dehydrogenase YdiJ n=1 Tax=Pseudoxanthomonas koreensis TaxID=266061 RepID=UPI0035A60DED